MDLFPFLKGPTGHQMVVDASGRVVVNGNPTADAFVLGYGQTGRFIVVDPSGRLILSALSAGVGGGGSSAPASQMFEGWGFNNPSGTQAATKMFKYGIGGDSPIQESVMPRAGSVINLWVRSNQARVSGSLLIELRLNDVATGFKAILDAANPLIKIKTVSVGTHTFASSGRLVPFITTSGWAPNTADLSAALEVRFDS